MQFFSKQNKLGRGALVLLFAVLILTLSCGDDDNTSPRQWELTWSDEFEGLAGELPDSNTWKFDIGTDWGNAQLEYDTDRPENCSLDGNGNLAIVARQESFGGSSYTSARIKTQNLFNQKFGRIEARIKLPWGRGLWPAFWMLGADFEQIGWPQCGEIDIMEYRGQEPQIIHGSVHGPGYSAGNAVTSTYQLQGARFDDDFHLFAIEWSEDQIDFFVDDDFYQRIEVEDVSGEWVFNKEYFILLNMAVGGTFVGSPNQTTVFPQTMLVDYVRVYQEIN